MSDKAGQRNRMSPQERQEMILGEAVHFFARNGFSAQTRQLAEALGVSQGLIYRYFRSKDELIERVYERNFLTRWRVRWEGMLKDGAVPLDERLKAFYCDYLKVVDDYDWIRIAMHSGLSGNNLTKRYIEGQVEGLLRVIDHECRRAMGEDATLFGIGDEFDIERVWHLHSTFIYYLVRKHVLATKVTSRREELVSMVVDNFLSGFNPRSV